MAMQIKGVPWEKQQNGRAPGDSLEIWEKPGKNGSVGRNTVQQTICKNFFKKHSKMANNAQFPKQTHLAIKDSEDGWMDGGESK